MLRGGCGTRVCHVHGEAWCLGRGQACRCACACAMRMVAKAVASPCLSAALCSGIALSVRCPLRWCERASSHTANANPLQTTLTQLARLDDGVLQGM
eukprot:1973429-Rhodomonas_salina.1